MKWWLPEAWGKGRENEKTLFEDYKMWLSQMNKARDLNVGHNDYR